MWETITGSAHTVVDRPQDRDRYPLARPGDVILTLEARTHLGTRVGQTNIVSAQAVKWATFDLHAAVLDDMVRKLDEHPIR